MNIALAIQKLYPAASVPADYIVQDDGDGPYLAYWNPALGNQPTQEELDAAVALVEDAALIATFTDFIQSKLDAFAKTRGYDSMASLVSYADDPDEILSTEGSYGKTVRSAYWVIGRTVLEDVRDGSIALPSLGEFGAMLPELEWPQ